MKPVEERPMIPTQGIVGPAQPFLVELVVVLLRMFSVTGYRLNRVLPKDGTEAMAAPLPLMEYIAAELPAAGDWEGAVVYVSDGAVGAKFRASNGAAWVNLG